MTPLVSVPWAMKARAFSRLSDGAPIPTMECSSPPVCGDFNVRSNPSSEAGEHHPGWRYLSNHDTPTAVAGVPPEHSPRRQPTGGSARARAYSIQQGCERSRQGCERSRQSCNASLQVLRPPQHLKTTNLLT